MHSLFFMPHIPGVETIILLRVFDILDIDTKPGYIFGFLIKIHPCTRLLKI
jgi:hypothetical protein